MWDCELKYIGQTRRTVMNMYKEHKPHTYYERTSNACATYNNIVLDIVKGSEQTDGTQRRYVLFNSNGKTDINLRQ